jgi:hypothetical protein
MKKPLLIGLVVGFIVIAGALWYLLSLKSTQFIPPITQPKPTPAVTQTLRLIPELSRTSQGTNLVLWWQPEVGTIPLSTVGVELTIKNPQGQVKALSATPTWSEEYQTPTWHVAFANLVNNPTGTVTFKFSAVNVAPEPMNLSQKTQLVSFPINLPANGTIELDVNPSVSQAFDKQNRPISVAINQVAQSPQAP